MTRLTSHVLGCQRTRCAAIFVLLGTASCAGPEITEETWAGTEPYAVEASGTCSDVPPDDRYSCAQQAGWGKCNETWMRGHCDSSCGRCRAQGASGTCSDNPPDDRYSCAQQAGWGKCNETWMQGRCDISCGRCKPNGPQSPQPPEPGNGSSNPPVSPSAPDGPSRDAMATHFDGLGQPAGGCGIPEGILETPNFVALNVQNTPGDYGGQVARPISNAGIVGEFNNGKNCGRWVRVTMGSRCSGTNDGAAGQSFCRGGSWQADEYNGATLDMLVADSCQDGNGWCRDDRFHLDLSTSSLTRFAKDSKVVSGLPQHFGNRQISWQYVEAPNYAGDIKIGFRNGAKYYWPAVAITHLKNGIHGVKSQINGSWVDATMVGDNGQVYQLPISNPPYRIQVIDSTGRAANGGRVYEFNFPSSCGSECSVPFTEVRYQTR